MSHLKTYHRISLFFLMLLVIAAVQGQGNSPQLTATLQDGLLIDRNANGRLDAGDTVRYTLEITNCGSVPAENVQFTGQQDPNTRFLASSVQVGAPVPAAPCPPPQVINPTPNPTATIPPVDNAPAVQSTTPTNGETEVALDANITVQFSKEVDVSGNWFEITCATSGQFNVGADNVDVTGGPITFTLNPDINLQSGETCTVTILAANINDSDSNDPPDTMAADYIFSFTTETPPTVVNTTPANGAVAVLTDSDIVITFDEPVAVTAASFALECPAGSTFSAGFSVSGSGTDTITINPTGNLPAGTTCQVNISATQVSDIDANDPPDFLDGNSDGIEGDDYAFSFTLDVDAAPTVQTITPANGAISVPTATLIEIVFSEEVRIDSAAAFSVECPSGLPSGFTVTTPTTLPANASTFVITPASPLPDATTCMVRVIGALVSDVDANDPPDTMAADFVSTFTTEAQPGVIATSPTDGAMGIATNSTIVIDFDEPVDVTTASFDLECPVGTPIAYTIGGSGTSSITLSPTALLPATATCTVTVNAAQISDSDLIDPPDNMAANYVFSFDTLADAAPRVDQPAINPASTSTGPNSASVDNPVSITPTLTIPFTEAVDATAGAFTLTCSTSGSVTVNTTPALSALGVTSIDVSPAAALAVGETCNLTVNNGSISDTDPNDPPNSMAADFSLSFAVDTPPAETLTETELGDVFQNVTGAGSSNVDLDTNIQITFNEAVAVTFPANGLQCPAGNAVPVTVTTNNAVTVVLNPDINLPLNTLCVLNIPAANISDVDLADAPDNPLAGVSHSFQTVDDDAPTVSSISPADGNNTVAANTNIVINFGEPVTLTGAWFTLSCTLSGSRVSTGELTGTGIIIIENTPDLVYTIDPTVNFAPADVCTVTIAAANVADNDTIDPPNLLDGNSDTIEGDDFVSSFSVQAVAIDDAYTITPHLTYNSGSAGLSVLDNDQPASVTITGFGNSAGTANGTAANGSNSITAGGAGGRVVLSADGTFLFYPDAGDNATAGTATFFYTIAGGDTAQVTLTFAVREFVWFVDSSAPGSAVCTGSNVGTQACPAVDLATVAGVDTANDTLFVASGSYTCGITLETGTLLIGDGASETLQTLSGVAPVPGSNFAPYATMSGTDPILTSSAADCVTLATGNRIQGLTIGNTADFAGIVGANYGTLTVLETTVSGSGQILNLDTGTVNATFDSLASNSSDNSFAALRVANSAVSFTSIGGTTVNGTAAGVEAILLTSNSGSGFNLGATSVNKTSAGRGVVLGNGLIQSAPVTFSSLSITTSAGTALEANRQTGTVTVSSNTGSISATGGAAVNIINTVGNTTPLALNLGALSANNSSLATTCLAGTSPAGFCASGATGSMNAASLTVTAGLNRYGARINNSSASFTFATVNISGMTVSSSEADTSPSDGFPDNSTSDGDGVFLSANTGSFTINGGSITNTNGSGADNVDIRSSSNVAINNVTLSGAGKSNLQAINMTGTGSFNNGTVTGAGAFNTADAFYFRANAGTLTRFDIDNTNCTMSTSASAEDCFEFVASGIHTALVDIGSATDSGVWRSNTNTVEAVSEGSANLTLNMQSIDASPISSGVSGMVLGSNDTSSLIFRVLNNSFTNIGNGLLAPPALGTIRVFPEETSTMRGRFEGNFVDTVPTYENHNVYISTLGNPSALELYINNNTLEVQDVYAAIYFRTVCNGCIAQSSGDIFIQNNVITGLSDSNGIELSINDEAGTSGLRFNITGNTVNLPPAGIGYGILINVNDLARNVDATLNTNVLDGGLAEFRARTRHINNNFCLNFTNHVGDDVSLINLNGVFEVVNYPALAANNPGSTIMATGTITNVGSCSTPTSSGLVREYNSDEAVASLPAPNVEENQLTSLLHEVFSFGAQPVHAQNTSASIPIGPLNIGTIPANSTVIVTFDVEVNAVIPTGTNSISLQGVISGTNFASILSDDPETAVNIDATRTPLGALRAVNALPQTGEASIWHTFFISALQLGVFTIGVFGLMRLRRRFFSAF